MHLSLKSSLGRQILTGTYVKDNRVLDLTTPFSELTFTLEDKSGEGNDATLYSGRYISTDGSTDRGIVADCSAAGVGSYYLTGKVRPNAVTTAELTMDGSTDSGLTGLTADVWQTFTTATSAVTPSAVQVGYDGSTASAADWSDVRLIDASDGSTVARWQLNESADGDLNGYPALDSSGNGYHGTHTGCAGGTGEGIDADVAGAVYAANEDKMYFDGVDDYINLGAGDPLGFNGASKIEVKAKIVVGENPASIEDIFYAYINLSSVGFSFDLQTNGTIRASGRSVTSDGYENFTSTTTVNLKSENIIEVYLDYANDEIGIRINGGSYETGAATFANGTYTYGASSLNTRIGNSEGLGRFFTGLIYDVEVYKDDALIDSYEGYGNTDGDWTDQIGSNNGTVNGSPVTVGQKRATILQTAGMNWNKRMWFDGVDDYVATNLTSNFSVDLKWEIDFIFSDSGVTGRIFQSRDPVTTTYQLNLSEISDGRIIAQVIGATANESLTLATAGSLTKGQSCNVVLEWDASATTLTATLNGGTPQTTGAAGAITDSGVYRFGSDRGVASFWKGVILAASFNDGSTTWDGTIANLPAGWTVNGTPSNFLIPESDSTPTNDALGNAIANPRPTSDTWNLFGDGEYGEVLDADSLDVTTEASWELWINPFGDFGVDKAFLSKWESTSGRSWMIYQNDTQADNELSFICSSDGTSATTYLAKIPVTDALAHVVFTFNGSALKGYINGSEVTVTVITGTLPASLYVGTEPIQIGVVEDTTSPAERQISRPKIYNTALTADQVLQNYNAQKGAFGL